MWELPGPGLESLSPALAGRFLTTAPPGKPWGFFHVVSISGLFLFITEWYQYIVFINYFIYLFLAALGLRCCTRASSSCGEQGLLFVAVRGLLIVAASLVVEHGL